MLLEIVLLAIYCGNLLIAGYEAVESFLTGTAPLPGLYHVIIRTYPLKVMGQG